MAIPYIDKGRVVDLSGNDIICRNILVAGPVGSSGFKQLFGNGLAPISSTSTSITLTAANILTGILIVNSAGSTVTLDTAVNIVAAVNNSSAGANIGDVIAFEASANTGTITIAAGTGGTFDTNVVAAARIIPISGAKTVFLRLTNVTLGSEAYAIYM